MPYELPPMRPPSEARSLLLRVMRGCPWNYCTFCFAYKELSRKDCLRPLEDVLQAARHYLHPDQMGIGIAGPSTVEG